MTRTPDNSVVTPMQSRHISSYVPGNCACAKRRLSVGCYMSHDKTYKTLDLPDGARLAYEVLGSEHLQSRRPLVLIGGASNLRGDWDRLSVALSRARPGSSATSDFCCRVVQPFYVSVVIRSQRHGGFHLGQKKRRIYDRGYGTRSFTSPGSSSVGRSGVMRILHGRRVASFS